MSNEVNCKVDVYNISYDWDGSINLPETPSWSGVGYVEFYDLLTPDHSRRGVGKVRDTEIAKGVLFIFDNIEINIGDIIYINNQKYKVWQKFVYIDPTLSWRSGRFDHIEVVFR